MKFPCERAYQVYNVMQKVRQVFFFLRPSGIACIFSMLRLIYIDILIRFDLMTSTAITVSLSNVCN